MLSTLFHIAVFTAGFAQALPQPTPVPNAATPVRAATTPAPQRRQAAVNPFAGYNFYANPYYSSEVHSLAMPSLAASLRPAAEAVAKVGSFVWLDTRAKVPTLDTYLADIKQKNAAGAKLVGTFVVYNLPDRDCAALASNGELLIDQDGVNKYKVEYIDKIAAILKKYPDVKVNLAIEPDSLANLITNMGVPKCSRAAPYYRDLTAYALRTLNLANVDMYLDGGHAGWLGWDANIGPAAKVYAEVYKAAGSPRAVRGLVTNVSNYNAFRIGTCPAITNPNANCDEERFIKAFAPLLEAQGFPAHFIVDVGRSGKQPTGQQAWGDWCNVQGAGFGPRPTTDTGNSLVDALVWVKPGGESDGTSDTSAPRYDAACGRASAFKPAPEAGTWFNAYFEMLLKNANPALA
ncbi:hypothetical protein SLS59_009999 [Nothophoma quercina]|uniref:Glucanase n=1 Tax=Nothophoma quercina TaxID=749835 RepID=A0ABR3QI96_9PLEO